MRVAVSSSGNTLESDLDPRFGRASYFLIVDTETFNFEVKPNDQNMNLPQGAGIQAGKTVADCGVDVLITGNCGPKAYNVLQAAGIKVVTGIKGSVKEVVEQFKSSDPKYLEGPNVDGHWV